MSLKVNFCAYRENTIAIGLYMYKSWANNNTATNAGVSAKCRGRGLAPCFEAQGIYCLCIYCH